MLGAGAGALDHDGGGVGHDDGHTLVRLPLAAGDHGGGERAAARRAADRRGLCVAGGPEDLGSGAVAARPQCGRPMGPVSILCRSAQIHPQGAGHPRRRQQGRLSVGAACDLRAGARGLGGDPGQRRLGHLQHQCRRALYFRHLVARRLRRDHGRLGVEFEISVPRGAAFGGTDGVLRGLDRLRHHHRAALRRLAESLRHCRGAAPSRSGELARRAVAEHLELVLAAAIADAGDLLHFGAGRDQPAAVRSGRSGIRTGSRLHGRIRLDART